MSEIESTPAPEAPKAAPTFVGGRSRFEVVDLLWPVKYDGRIWDKITVSRLTAKDVAEFMRRLKDAGDDAEVRFPFFDAPDEVLDALDDDDSVRLNEVAARFLPQRFRVEAAPGSAPPSGGATEPTSAS